jgi:predicted amino acid-binding ACT domain protein
MSEILNFLKKTFSVANRLTTNEAKDYRKAECPYCHKELKKVPGAKTKCQHCSNFMYVRTSIQNIKVVVTKEDANKIDREWTIVSGAHDTFASEKQEHEKHKSKLKKKFGKEPSDDDVRWSIFNKRLIEYAQNKQWGLYRNNRLEMAEHLRGKMKLKQALTIYLEVCFLDTNGPNNYSGIGDVNDAEILKEFPRFDPSFCSELSSGIVDIINMIIKELGLNIEEVKKTFMEHNFRIAKSFKTPLLPKQSWLVLEKELKSQRKRLKSS